jgi:large repetitive protein
VKIKTFLAMLTILVSISLASCGSTTAPTTYTIGGTVSGLSGTGLVLQDNGTDNLQVSANGAFTFATAIVSGNNYAVTILTQPANPAQTCAVTYGGTGTVTANVVIVQVICNTNSFTVGVAVSGLSGTGLVLQNNGGNSLPVGANGNYTFSTTVSRGSSYNVTVVTQPSGQTCNVTNGYGANITGNVTNVQVTCYLTTMTFTIGGTVSGLSGTGLVLQDNSGDNLPLNGNGSFTFPTAIASGSTYSVTVLTQPTGPSQNCVVAGGGGTASANITGILVNCTTITYPIGGTISGLTGSGLVLQDNGGNNLPVSAGATSFTFAAQVASGSSYTVTVFTQPSSPSCSITDGSGTVTNVAISNIVINCVGSAFNISATVSGLLANTSVVLQDNGGDSLTVSSNGIATNFNTALATGASYAVTVQTQPAGTTCTVGTNASGKVASADINVAVTCGVTIAAGVAHTCVVTSAGGVLCWGSNEYGQLGNGETANSTTPVSVAGLSTDVVSIAAGSNSTCALTSAGDVWCWGDNAAGQLGNGSFTASSLPVKALGTTGDTPLNGVIAIAAGESHACAVTSSGAALCWGDNSNGQLGNGGEIGSSVPVIVSGLSTGVATIAAGSDFTCAVLTDTKAFCWGEGSNGQLGNGSTASVATPVAVLDSTGKTLLNGVVAISAGFENTCALTDSGTAFCWGANGSGQLGSGSVNSQSNIPVQVMDSTGQSALNVVVAISGGLDNNCAVTSTGAALCWGRNDFGQLGIGNTTNTSAPAPVFGLTSGVAAIAAGYHHSCAVTSTAAAQCWGFNLNGQLASGSTSSSLSPTEAVGVGGLGLLRLF